MLGISYFLGAILWAALATFVLVFSGSGDGAGGGANRYDQVIAYTPSLYLLLLFAACFRGLPTKLVNSLLVLAGILLVFFSVVFFRLGEMGLIVPLPFIVAGVVGYQQLRGKTVEK